MLSTRFTFSGLLCKFGSTASTVALSLVLIDSFTLSITGPLDSSSSFLSSSACVVSYLSTGFGSSGFTGFTGSTGSVGSTGTSGLAGSYKSQAISQAEPVFGA